MNLGKELSFTEPQLWNLYNGHETVHCVVSLGGLSVSWHGKALHELIHYKAANGGGKGSCCSVGLGSPGPSVEAGWGERQDRGC